MISFPVAILAGVLWIGATGPQVQATPVPAEFEEHGVVLRNQAVKLAGSLLLPRREIPISGVVFVHGAGRQTREPYREAAEYFARQGIAALIYDKRGVGQSSGAYESREPYDNLVHDALAAVGFLKQRREMSASPIGLWGLSQGGYIGAAAAARSQDIEFVVAVGASVAEGAKYFYRENLFRRYGLSDRLRDVAEKAQLAQDTLPHNLRHESFLASFGPRSYAPPDQYVHPAWCRVNQPVLAMWGEFDQVQPVGESVAGLRNSLAQANNRKWTMVILPRANHGLGISETGELHRGWRGYAPDALPTMTDWIRGVVEDPAGIDTMKQVGAAPPAEVLSKLKRYENLRWFGHGTVQATLWIVFLAGFLANSMAIVRSVVARLFFRHRNPPSPVFQKLLHFKRAVGALNFLILLALGSVTFLVFDQIRPACPAVLTYLPVLGTISILATGSLLVGFAIMRHDRRWTAADRIRCSLDALCFGLFIPYMVYWNAIGLRF